MKLQNLLMIGAICSLAACGESQSQAPTNETAQSQTEETNIAISATKLARFIARMKSLPTRFIKAKSWKCPEAMTNSQASRYM